MSEIKDFLDFENWLIKEHGKESFKPGIENLKKTVLSELKSISIYHPKIITIAGTNGKGETAHYLSEILKYNNISYTLWTSPHILSLQERFQNNEGYISFFELMNFHKALKNNLTSLSFYEYLLAIFIKWTEKNRPEYILLEVGLGGRLDGVNVFDATTVLIPSISRDHQDILGFHYRDILKEKYGVVRKRAKLITTLNTHYLNEILSIWTSRDEVNWINLGFEMNHNDFSFRNFHLALSALNDLNIPNFADLPTRPFVGEAKGTNITLYGSHNTDGIRNLVQKLSVKCHNFDNTLLVFSKRPIKEMETMIHILESCPGVGEVTLGCFDHAKAMDTKELAKGLGKNYCHDWKTYLKQHQEEKILITGSYYFLGQVLDYIKSNLS